MRVELPESFEKRMQEMLGDEYESYIESYDNPRQYGLRINPMKITEEELAEGSGFSLDPIPWTKTGYFYKEEDQPARHPYYSAGLYYLQEPSAMTPAARFPVEPGERVLDLCAAPGGKATALGAALQGKGVLVANDISNSRAKALLKNLEVFGISNAFVTNEVPQNLAERFEGFFDKVLIDAPCSGEGMFRKDPAVIKTWEEERPEYFAKLQKDILKNGVRMLRPGGKLLYSTCTFAPVENEGSISWILEQCPEMELIPIEGYEGFSEGNPAWGDGREELRRCVRIWPHKMKGEGHYLALLRKGKPLPVTDKQLLPGKKSKKKLPEDLEVFLEDTTWELDAARLDVHGERVYYMPEELPDVCGIRFLRTGLLLGELKKKRFEPSQALAMCLKKDEYKKVLDFPVSDERVKRYLKGETLDVEDMTGSKEKGWYLVCVDGYPLGFGKLSGQTLKNKYLPGWRLC